MLTKVFAGEVKELDALGQFEAYAATFGNIDRQGDKIARGAFLETIAESKGRYPFLMAHDTSRIAGFGTHAEEDAKGLLVSGELILDSDEGRNAYAIMKTAAKLKAPLGFSIGYGVPEGGAKRDEKTGVRTLSKIVLYEYSIACVPANPRARMTDVKASEWTRRELETQLCEIGLSRAAAKAVVAGGYQALKDQRDVDAGAVVVNADDQRDVDAVLRAVLAKAGAVCLANGIQQRRY